PAVGWRRPAWRGFRGNGSWRSATRLAQASCAIVPAAGPPDATLPIARPGYWPPTFLTERRRTEHPRSCADRRAAGRHGAIHQDSFARDEARLSRARRNASRLPGAQLRPPRRRGDALLARARRRGDARPRRQPRHFAG